MMPALEPPDSIVSAPPEELPPGQPDGSQVVPMQVDATVAPLLSQVTSQVSPNSRAHAPSAAHRKTHNETGSNWGEKKA